MSEGDAAPGSGRRWLTVEAANPETDDARHLTLAPAPGDAGFFDYEAGQFLTFRLPHPGGALERSYSLSSAPGSDPQMTICVKRVAGGRGSNWMVDHLRPGDRLEARRPAGRFTLRESAAPVLLVAGGSGVTPCLALIKRALIETERPVRLVYANRHAGAVIYGAVLAALERRFAPRFDCRLWLDAARGLITGDEIVRAVGDAAPDCYICGPAPLMEMAEERLGAELGPEATILTERFLSPEEGAAEPIAAATPSLSGGPASFKLTLDGVDHMAPLAPDQTLLQAALAAGIDAPNSCTEGHCGACMGKLREGEVSMVSTKALSKRNLERGFVLACQARPASSEPIWLDFDL